MPAVNFRFADRSSRTADSLQSETSQIAVSNGWVTDAKKRQNRAQTGIKMHDSTSRKGWGKQKAVTKAKKRSVPDILAKTKLIKQLVLVVVIGSMLRFGLNSLGWHPPSLEKRLIPALVLWMIFGLYWGIAGRQPGAPNPGCRLISINSCSVQPSCCS